MALVICLVPAGRILQGNARDGNSVALAEIDVLGTVDFTGTVELESVSFEKTAVV